MTVFVTADTHFNHAGVLAMCGRPFADVAEHNEALIAAWNRSSARATRSGTSATSRSGGPPKSSRCYFGACAAARFCAVGTTTAPRRPAYPGTASTTWRRPSWRGSAGSFATTP